MEPFITVEHLKKSYDGTPVFEDFSLEVPKGKIFGMIGPNGAGKSTIIGILNGLISHDTGRVVINGRELNEKNELAIKKEVASVLQPPLLFEHFSSYDFLTYICDMYGIEESGRRDKIYSLMDFLGLAEFEHAKISKLSSGSRKKLSFCAAILSEPKLLFLDEPFESIDVISIGRMKAILRRLQEKEVTIFITSHILEIVENLCDDIAILHEGKIIAYLDKQSRMKLEGNASLSEIFENYIDVRKPKSDVLKWL